jgi:uncharacterized protein
LAVVADTGPLFAAILRRDDAHQLAAALIEYAGRDLLVPDPVIVECESLLRVRGHHEGARRFLDALVAGNHVRVTMPPSLFATAVAIDRQYRDLNLGLVDASVMAVASAMSSAILTFDFRDFRAAPPLAGGTWELVIDEADYTRVLRHR